MSDTDVLPELKQIIGALLFAAREPLAMNTIKKVFKDAAKQFEGPVQDFGQVGDNEIKEAIAELDKDLKNARVGIKVGEVANGYRLENELSCGIWIRQMLEKGRSTRLSKPALETLAIIAYRQPCTRSEIEAVRGVQVDAIMKNLIEMQLVKVVGRSDLPGRPWLHATTKKFLEYFGLKDVDGLPGIEELKKIEEAKQEAERRRNEAVEAEETVIESSDEELPETDGPEASGDPDKKETLEEPDVVEDGDEEEAYDDEDEFDEEDDDEDDD